MRTNELNFTITEHAMAIEKFWKDQETYYLRKKEYFLEKYGISEIKTNKPHTALEPSN
jgi:hypothetical protein